MADYILLRGPIGVGKTTISNLLDRRLSEEGYVNSLFPLDTIRNENVGRRITYDAKKRTIELVVPIINLLICNKRLPLIEGVLYEQDLFMYLINNIYGRALKVKLIAPLEVCIQRDSKRKYPRGSYKVIKTWNSLQDVHDDCEIDTRKKSIEEIVNIIVNEFRSS